MNSKSVRGADTCGHPYAVGPYITAAYWFTASTSFANPAAAIPRALSDTYAGIAPAGVLSFIVAQLDGALAAVGLAHWLFDLEREAGASSRQDEDRNVDTPQPLF
jgi:glycerol uptake facilitator-like aquaporin